MIVLERVTKKFNIGKPNEIAALNDINLEIKDNEMLAVTGRSGSGKSTLLHIIGCLDNATSGSCVVDGTDTKKLSDGKLAKLRNEKIGILLQDFALVNSESAIQNVKIPQYFSKTPVSKMNAAAMNALKMAGITELCDQKVATMSGGQKQRVALARALVNHPSVLLCDEPTGALDSKTAEEIMEQIAALNKSGMTVIIVTHDMKVAECCERIIELSDGRVVQSAKVV